MKVLRIYIENSVIGGYFDDEFKEHTYKLFEKIKKGICRAVISSHVIAELENGAPDYVKENLKTIDYEEYTVNDEMIKLAEKYMEQNIVSENYTCGKDIVYWKLEVHGRWLKMNKKKQFDCIKFKNELQEKLLEKSGAKNIQEYAAYVNKFAQNSSLHKKKVTV